MMTLLPWETPPVSSLRDLVLRPARTRRTGKTDKELEAGAAGSGHPASAQDRRDSRAGHSAPGEIDVSGDATTSELVRQRESSGS
jgi:hypothetical protein